MTLQQLELRKGWQWAIQIPPYLRYASWFSQAQAGKACSSFGNSWCWRKSPGQEPNGGTTQYFLHLTRADVSLCCKGRGAHGPTESESLVRLFVDPSMRPCLSVVSFRNTRRTHTMPFSLEWAFRSTRQWMWMPSRPAVPPTRAAACKWATMCMQSMANPTLTLRKQRTRSWAAKVILTHPIVSNRWPRAHGCEARGARRRRALARRRRAPTGRTRVVRILQIGGGVSIVFQYIYILYNISIHPPTDSFTTIHSPTVWEPFFWVPLAGPNSRFWPVHRQLHRDVPHRRLPCQSLGVDDSYWLPDVKPDTPKNRSASLTHWWLDSSSPSCFIVKGWPENCRNVCYDQLPSPWGPEHQNIQSAADARLGRLHLPCRVLARSWTSNCRFGAHVHTLTQINTHTNTIVNTNLTESCIHDIYIHVQLFTFVYVHKYIYALVPMICT